MARVLIAASTLIALLSGSALSQTTTVTTPAPSVNVSVDLNPEQRTKIKEYVVQQKVKPITVKERVSIGGVLPQDVELMAVPNDWGPSVAQYRYVYSDNHVMLVEPSSRRVVQIID